MVKTDSARPKAAHALELQRGVTGIVLKKAVLLIRQALNRRSQAPIRGPKLRRGEVPQNSVDFPAAWARRASSASASSFPAFTSRSICPSHAAASNSTNHRRNSNSSSAERPETFFSRASSLLIRRNDTIFSFHEITPLSGEEAAHEDRVGACRRCANRTEGGRMEGRFCGHHLPRTWPIVSTVAASRPTSDRTAFRSSVDARDSA